MIKKRLLRKGAAYLLSAAMVLASIGVVPGVVIKTASAAVDIPKPVINLDFESNSTTGNIYTEDGINYTLTDSEITANPDGEGKVYYNGGDTTGFMQSEQGAFQNISFAEGISVHMKVRPNTQASDWNYLFGLGFISEPGWRIVDGTIGFIIREWTTAHSASYFPHEFWQPGNNVNSDYLYFTKEENCNKKWYNLTYVYGADGNFFIYVDGILAVKYTATNGYNAVFNNIGNNNNAIFSLGGNVFNVFTDALPNDTNIFKRCDAYYDDVKIFNKTLTQEQVYVLATGREVQETNKEALTTTISEAEKEREELYLPEAWTAFKQKLDAAIAVKNNVSATQNEIDTAVIDLNAAKNTLKSGLKPIDLTKDLVLDSDMSIKTSVVDKTKKEIIAGGHTINALGISSIGDGYIQSSTDGTAQQAGVSLDKSVLEGVSLDTGLTFNVQWKFSKAPPSDWWDLISIVNASNGYLMRNTVGFTTLAGTGKTNETVGADSIGCKNGFKWDSCKSYETNVIKNFAVTIDNTGFRMYVDGVLACEKTDMTKYDFSDVFNNMAKIYIGYGLLTTDGDLHGQLHGLQVYHRALNAAEVDKLAKDGTGASFELSSVTASVKKGETQTVSIADTVIPAGTTIKSAVSENNKIATVEVKNGEVVITGVDAGETTVIINTSCGQSTACSVTVYTEKIAVESVTLDKETESIEAGSNLTLNTTVLPENATNKGIIWSSSDEAVAIVNSNGVVTALAAGETTITATSEENNTLSASCVVTVTKTETPGGDDEPGTNTDNEIRDESQLGLYRDDMAYSRVSVHDPSIVQDPETKRYYIFGSHCAWAWSDDLENWEAFTNNITEGNDGSAHTIFKDEINWCKKADANYTVTGNLWAPDIIWDEDYKNADGTTGAWLMYMSINGPKWNSTISLLTSDRLDGKWTYIGPVIQSGMSNGFGPTFDYEKVTGGTDVKRYTDSLNGRNPTIEAHAIDPCVLYDEKGNLWMSYGSWSGGNAVSGEGSYIKKIGEYYYLFLS